MNNPAPHPPTPITATEVAARLDSILTPLLAVITAHFRILGHLGAPLWNRISHARQRITRLLALLAAGRKPHPSGSRIWRCPPPVPPEPGVVPLPGTGPAPYLSRRFAWIIIRIGYRAGGFASQLSHLLQQPGVAEILAASPGAARSMRPLCRMLGIDLPLALRRPAPPPRPPAPRRPKPRPAAPLPFPPGTPDRPLPAYIRAAVRAWKRPRPKIA